MMKFIKNDNILVPNDALQDAIIREDGKSIRDRQSMSAEQIAIRKASMRRIIKSSEYLSQFSK